MKKILMASDHAGLGLKKYLLGEIGPTSPELQFVDLGVFDEKSVDYPDLAKKLCAEIFDKKAEFGILICGSGQGMCMQANRFKGIRAALCWDLPSAQLSREHNNANVLCLGSRLIPFGYGVEITKLFLKTPFLGGRHQMRVDKLDQN